jgi:hypothetical protein
MTVSSADVATDPTAMAFTRMRGARSAAARRVRWARPALAVPYASMPRSAMRPMAELMFTTAPSPRSSIAGTAAFVRTKAVVTLKWKARSR